MIIFHFVLTWLGYKWAFNADLCVTDVLSLQVDVEHSCHPETKTVQSDILLCFNSLYL